MLDKEENGWLNFVCNFEEVGVVDMLDVVFFFLICFIVNVLGMLFWVMID